MMINHTVRGFQFLQCQGWITFTRVQKNGRGEYVWVVGTGATASGIPYSEL